MWLHQDFFKPQGFVNKCQAKLTQALADVLCLTFLGNKTSLEC